MSNQEVLNWDQYLMSMVYFVAMRSKDQSTHIGAVIVDDKHRILSCGYNSFPAGIDDNVPERQERPEKYFWMSHAEVSSLLFAKRDLTGAILYTQGTPCMDCARAIVQSGIKEVVVHKQWEEKTWNEKWEENAKRTKILFKEAGVNLRIYDGDIVREIYGFISGEKF